ncbi:Peptidyl-prolyl cis-trans isomerase [Mycoavidus cysteinexigens]|uniref:Periplasmic chaperone PpiD n=1 Tax=Mycoavidus cysteinexigens TaxID=1553431 RepID=A0A2Z6EVG3_9BURK|nr:SurA N-terminal domain-containing protein [Mycoavidus cysteinexigens]BBE09421.1 Peptidyl-prolyl cis-trans isomerase [Mycoavidus cysteinexigens]GAM51822.1 peptidyl-prolyl cis-trans isomerase PpiD [bacterium endosymbiont of Mortierella elongata FMR23-6]GLR01640.1 peptidylprolyl isomerase [Mycoavidus cysteinexigens]
MFDFIRNHKRLMLILLALLIVPGLGLVGVQGFRGFFDNGANVAEVSGSKITRQEYDALLKEQLERMREMFGGAVNTAAVDTPVLRQILLDSLIQQRILADEAKRQRLSASDEAVRKTILEIPALGALRKSDGSIDTEKYHDLLAKQGMTPEQFDARVRRSLAIAQIGDSIEASALAPKSSAAQLAQLSMQQREMRELVLHPLDYSAEVKPTEEQLKQYYDTHQKEFETPETATISYAILSAEILAASITPSEEELKKAYQDNLATYQTAKQVRASHILIATPKADTVASAKAKAEALLAQLRKQPGQFAEMARNESQDPGSAARGGDLGYFAAGMMVKPFEEAAFKLKPNEISGLVQSDFGYHIIKVTEIKPAQTRPLSEVKQTLLSDLKKQQATQRFAAAADQFSNLVYEQTNSLTPAAEKFNLVVQTATVARQAMPAPTAVPALANPQFLAAVFESETLKGKHNTAAIEVGDNTLIAAHVTAHKPASVLPFETVKQGVQQKVTLLQAAELTRKAGEEKLASLQQSKSTAGFSPVIKLSRAGARGLTPAAVSAIFKADAEQLPQYVSAILDGGVYAIYRVESLSPLPELEPQRLTALQQQLAQLTGQLELNAYLASLRARSKVKIYATENAAASE